MPDVYSVETTLKLNDQLLAGLRRVASQLRLVDADVQKLQRGLNTLKIPPGLAGQLGALRRNVSGVTMGARQAQQAFTRLRVPSAATTGAQTLSRSLGAATTNANRLSRAISSIPSVPAGTGGGRVPPLPPGMGPWGPRPGGGGGGGGAPGGPRAPRSSNGAHDLFTGLGYISLGGMALHSAGEFARPGMEYMHQLNVMNMAGMKHQEIVQAIGDSWRASGVVMSSTATENLRSLLDLRNVLGNWAEARTALPAVNKLQMALQSSDERLFKPGSGADTAQSFAFSAAKALDILGKVGDPAVFGRNMSRMGQVGITFQNRVTPRMFQGVFQYMRQAKFGLGEDFIYGILPTLMLEASAGRMSMGGGSRGVGPSIAAMSRVVEQGIINKKAIPILQATGLWTGGAVRTTTQGTTVGPLLGWEVAQRNPFEWATKVAGPHIRDYIRRRTGREATDQEMIAIINQMARGNQLFGAILQEFILKEKNFLRDQKLIAEAMDPVKAFENVQSNDPDYWRRAISAQWDNLRSAMVTSIGPALIQVMRGTAGGLRFASQFMHEHSTVGAVATYGLAGAAGLIGAGVAVRGVVFALRGLAAIPGLGALGRTLSGVASGLGTLSGVASRLAGIAGFGAATVGAAGMFAPNSMLTKEQQEGRVTAVDALRRKINRWVTGAAPGKENLPLMGGRSFSFGAHMPKTFLRLPAAARSEFDPLSSPSDFGDRERQAYELHPRSRSGARLMFPQVPQVTAPAQATSVNVHGEASIANHIVIEMGDLGRKVMDLIHHELINFSNMRPASPARPDLGSLMTMPGLP